MKTINGKGTGLHLKRAQSSKKKKKVARNRYNHVSLKTQKLNTSARSEIKTKQSVKF
jgi:hypothetical protein